MKNYGFIPEDKISPDDFLLGGNKMPYEFLQTNGQWDAFLPTREVQHYRDQFDSMNCTNYGTLNAIEILLKRKYGETHNFSERYTGVMTGTTKEGNSITKVVETIRKISGLIPEALLPFDDAVQTWEQYYSPSPMASKHIREGQKWLVEYELKHEWVVLPWEESKADRIKDALVSSPLAVAVYAWRERNGMYYRPSGVQDNHLCVLYGYDRDAFMIFDSYDSTTKVLEPGYEINFAKRFWIEKTGRRIAEPFPFFSCFKGYIRELVR